MNFTRNVEDYLEAIYNITQTQGFAQTKEIANNLRVTPPSVSGMLKKLKRLGLINYQKYSPVTLTPKGEQIAKKIQEEHTTIKCLLELLSVPKNIADQDACTIEHNLHKTTINQLRKFVTFIHSFPSKPKWLECFQKFCKDEKSIDFNSCSCISP
ncbi:MAG: metal-dependent transcriptional regulator [Candidatus Helarchaeota archaeon]